MNSVRKNHHSFYKDHLPKKKKAEESPITNYLPILMRNTTDCNSMQKKMFILDYSSFVLGKNRTSSFVYCDCINVSGC